MSILRLSFEDDGRSIKAHEGDVITITLRENPSTGYRWMAESTNEEAVQLQNTSFDPASKTMIGSGGARTFSFRVTSPGISVVRLRQRREWAGAASDIGQCEMTIEALP